MFFGEGQDILRL